MRVANISDLSHLSYRNILDICFTCAAWPVSSHVGNIKETFSLNRAKKYRVKLEILFWDFLLLYNHALLIVRQVSSFKDSDLINPSTLDLEVFE